MMFWLEDLLVILKVISIIIIVGAMLLAILYLGYVLLLLGALSIIGIIAYMVIKS
jgi:hypothetical protein